MRGYDAWLTNDPRMPSAAEEAAFDRISEEHPDWTDTQVWDEVQREEEDAEIDAAEARGEAMRDGDW